MPSPRIISLDIETYGAVERTPGGLLLPRQKYFHPRKSLAWDLCPWRELIQTVSITVPLTSDGLPPSPPPGGWCVPALADLTVGPTFSLVPSNPTDLALLRTWLAWSDCIVGMNLPFDITFLRAAYPGTFLALPRRRHLLIDLSVLNFMECEARPEKSLKSLGPVLGTHSYEETKLKKGERYKHCLDPELHKYNSEDSHNTLKGAIQLCRLICENHPNTAKLTARALKFFSDTLHSVIRMTETGICLSRSALEDLQTRLARISQLCDQQCDRRGLQLSGTGSGLSKSRLLDRLAFIPLDPGDTLEVTPKKKLISWTDGNRATLIKALPRAHPDSLALQYSEHHGRAQKLLSSYVRPLLVGRGPDNQDKSSTGIPNYEDHGLVFPSWYVTPSPIKDSQGSSGGTLQARITAKQPAVQTWPDEIKSCRRSHWGVDGVLVDMDLKQIELKVAAVLSGEESLLIQFRTGADLHSQRIQDLLSSAKVPQKIIDRHDWKRVWRQVGKTINFADLFGAGAETMQSQIWSAVRIKLPLELLQHVVHTRPKVRPLLHAWQMALLEAARRDGVLRLPITGHSRYFLGNLEEHRGEILNFPVQTTAANVLLAIQHEFDDRTPQESERILVTHQVYDSLCFDCPQTELPRLRQLIQDSVTAVAKTYWTEIGGGEGSPTGCPLTYDLKETTHP